MVTTTASKKKTPAAKAAKPGTTKATGKTTAKKPSAKKPVASAPAIKVKPSAKQTTSTTAKKTSASKTKTLPEPAKAIAAKPEKNSGKASGKAAATKAPAAGKKKTTVTPQERYRMISTAAYYLAESRGFASGYEVKDWLTAELEVDAKIK